MSEVALQAAGLVRRIEGEAGRVEFDSDLCLRFDYGHVTPWLQRVDGGLTAVAGPDAVLLTAPFELENRDFATVADFTIKAGKSVAFQLTWFPSHVEPPPGHVP